MRLVEGWWTTHILPRLVDVTLDNAYMRDLRQQLCREARGEVLEIGFGSGLNLPHYPPSVTRVSAVEPSDVAWERSAPRRRAAGVPVRRMGLDGAALALPDSSIDTAVSVFTLCTVPDATGALRELPMSSTRSISLRLSSFAARFLNRECRTGAMSLHTSDKFNPKGFILSLYPP